MPDVQNPSGTEETLPRSVTKPYKAILIIGDGHPVDTIPKALRDKFQQEGYLLLGNGTTNLKLLDYSKLSGGVDKETRIYVWAHGIPRGGIHSIGMLTRDFLKDKIAAYCNGIPLNIQLNSCYAGAAAPDVSVLPVGSVLVTHGPSDDSTAVAINSKVILESSQDLRYPDLVDDFIHRFALNVKQTATISIKKPDGSVFKHTVRPPRAILTNPDAVRRYLEFERTRFIVAYNLAFDKKLDPDKLSPITLQEAKEWRNDNFIHCVVIGDKKLIETLKANINKFDDYINCSLESGVTALTLAASRGHDELISAMLTSKVIDANNVRIALTIAVDKGHDKVVSAILASDKIDANNVRIALTIAVDKGHDKVVSAILAADKIDKTNVRNAFMRAVAKGHDKVVSALLTSNEIDANAVNMELVAAVGLGHDKVVSALLTLAADKIDAAYANRALLLVTTNNNFKIASTLITLAADKIDANGKLMYAVMRADDMEVSALLASSSDKIDAVILNNALKIAAQKRSDKVISALLISDKIYEGTASEALMSATEEGHDKVISALLTSNKIDADAVNKAFMLAAEKGDDRVVSALLASNKIDFTFENHFGHTALMLAASNGHNKAVAAMLKSGKIDATDASNALKLAAANGREKIVTTLLASDKIDADAASRALISASFNGYDNVVSLLLASKKINNINLQDDDGYTALMRAAAMGRDKVVTILLKLDNTKVDVESNYGETALMLAAQNGHKAIVDKLTPLVAKQPIGIHTEKLSKEPHRTHTDLVGKKSDIPQPVTIHTAAVRSSDINHESIRH